MHCSIDPETPGNNEMINVNEGWAQSDEEKFGSGPEGRFRLNHQPTQGSNDDMDVVVKNRKEYWAGSYSWTVLNLKKIEIEVFEPHTFALINALSHTTVIT